MERRTFLKLLLESSILAAYPGFALAKNSESSPDVVFLEENHHEYDAHRSLFNKQLKRRPKVIAVCYTEAGVIKGIAEARNRSLPLSIKSGGHSFEGFSMNDDSLVIDLTNMNSHTLTPDGQLITDPATRLMQLYEDMIPKGRILPTGSCGMVGIAGLTLGGGYGLFSRQYGLTCDYLKRLRLVDAEGRIHEVEQGSDLMWACRGGGNGNFGVVTQLEFSTVPAPEKLWRHVFKAYKLTTKRAVELVENWFAVTKDLPDTTFSAFVLNNRTLTILVTNTAAEMDAGINKQLSHLENMTDKRYQDKQQVLAKEVRRYYGRLAPLPFKNASAGYYQDFSSIKNVVEKVFSEVVSNRNIIFQINTLGGRINSTQAASQSAYTHRGANYLAEVQSYWRKTAQATSAIRTVKKIQQMLWDSGVREHYANYPDINFPHWAQAYYGEKNYRRLQEIKTKYDPDNWFRHPQSVTSL